MKKTARTAPRYDMMFGDGKFNATLLIGPDPFGAFYDYSVFQGARLKLKKTGFELTGHKVGLDIFETVFNHNGNSIRARIRLVHGRSYSGGLQELWRESLAYEDLVYLKSHAGYGKHLSLSDDVSCFTDAMKEGFSHQDRKPYQLYYLDCCKSEMYYRDVFREYVGYDGVDLILHQWFCNYIIIGPVVVLLRELMVGSDFETIVAEMNDEYGVPHVDVEDDPEDLKQDRKMVTYCVG